MSIDSLDIIVGILIPPHDIYVYMLTYDPDFWHHIVSYIPQVETFGKCNYNNCPHAPLLKCGLQFSPDKRLYCRLHNRGKYETRDKFNKEEYLDFLQSNNKRFEMADMHELRFETMDLVCAETFPFTNLQIWNPHFGQDDRSKWYRKGDENSDWFIVGMLISELSARDVDETILFESCPLDKIIKTTSLVRDIFAQPIQVISEALDTLLIKDLIKIIYKYILFEVGNVDLHKIVST
jgi:hypothetical protein